MELLLGVLVVFVLLVDVTELALRLSEQFLHRVNLLLLGYLVLADLAPEVEVEVQTLRENGRVSEKQGWGK